MEKAMIGLSGTESRVQRESGAVRSTYVQYWAFPRELQSEPQ